jgi:pyruvate-formate lyase
VVLTPRAGRTWDHHIRDFDDLYVPSALDEKIELISEFFKKFKKRLEVRKCQGTQVTSSDPKWMIERLEGEDGAQREARANMAVEALNQLDEVASGTG